MDDWESSFSQILNRTKHNLDKINKKYARPPPFSAPFQSENKPDSTHTHDSLYQSHNNSNNNYVSEEKSEFYSQQASEQEFLGHGKQNLNDSHEYVKVNASPVTVDPAFVENLHRRLETIEVQLNPNKQVEEQELSQKTGQLLELCTSLNKTTQQLQSQLHSTQMNLDLLQSDCESRRSFQSQIEHWMRQNDIWKNQIEEQLDQVRKGATVPPSLSHSVDWGDNGRGSRASANNVTRHDLDLLRQNVNAVIEEKVADGMNKIYENTERSIRAVEQKVDLPKYNEDNANESSSVELRLATKVRKHASRISCISFIHYYAFVYIM